MDQMEEYQIELRLFLFILQLCLLVILSSDEYTKCYAICSPISFYLYLSCYNLSWQEI